MASSASSYPCLIGMVCGGKGETMPAQTLEKRVATLEIQMSELRELPARVAEQGLLIVQLRLEMRDEFSAIRGEIGGLEERLRGEMGGLEERLRGEMRGLEERLHAEMRQAHEKLRTEMGEAHKVLRTDARVLNEETRVHMRVLHEELLARLTQIQEHQVTPPASDGRKKRTRRRTG